MESIRYSRASAQTVDLHKCWLTLKANFLPITGVFLGAVGISVLIARSQEEVYQAQSRILVRESPSIQLAGLEDQVGSTESVGAKSDPLTTTVELIRSTVILQKTIDQLKLKDEQGLPLKVEAMLHNLEVKPVPGTDIVEISYQGEKPHLVAEVVNTIVELYQHEHDQAQVTKVVAARQFIEEQLPQLAANLSQTENELRLFKEKHDIANLVAQKAKLIAHVNFLEQEIAQTESELAYASAKLTQVDDILGMGGEEAIAASALSQSQGVQQAQQKLQQLEVEQQIQSSRFSPSHPRMMSIQEEKDFVNQLLQERIKQTLGHRQQPTTAIQMGQIEQDLVVELTELEINNAGIIERLASLKENKAEYAQYLAAIPRLESQQRKLELQLTASQTTYKTLSSQLEQLKIAQDLHKLNKGNVRVIETALAPVQALPNYTPGIVAAGSLLGLVASFGLVGLFARLDNSLNTLKDAQGAFAYTLLGVVPNFDTSGQASGAIRNSELNIPRVVARDMPYSTIQEAYQMLRANLKFLSADKPIQSIVVTSSVHGEGKSEVCANLAVAMTQVGLRVLLIDADLRQPTQHHVWNLENTMGLSDVLAQRVEGDEVIQTTLLGLDVISAGSRMANPSPLLDSGRMKQLMSSLALRYDAIIVDTPPVTAVPDALMLGKMSDGVLLVTRPGVVDADSASDVRELMAIKGQKVLGMVANGINVSQENHSYFYYQQEQLKPSERPKVVVPMVSSR